MKERVAQAGIAVFVLNEDNQVLLGVRIAKPGNGNNEWQLPGGKITHMEDWIDTCKREVKEETDLNIFDIHFVTARNQMFPHVDQHFVCSFFVARVFTGEPKVMEPKKCFKWEWVDIDDIPEVTFWPIKEIVSENYNKIIGD
jgi:8-oxo-dGTP diphosphatase